MNDLNGKDLFNKKFVVEKPTTTNNVSEKKSFYKPLLTDQANPKNIANLVGALATIAGYLGLHDFFCGNYRNGTLKFIFSVIGILAPISVLWSIVDCYKIGNGTYRPQRELSLVAVPWCKKVAIAEAILCFTITVLIFRKLVSLFMGM